MIYLIVTAAGQAAGAAALAVVYVMSKDSGRRMRAWHLLKLLIRR
jgi:hypothetical protein